jgi:hypothetical protein
MLRRYMIKPFTADLLGLMKDENFQEKHTGPGLLSMVWLPYPHLAMVVLFCCRPIPDPIPMDAK